MILSQLLLTSLWRGWRSHYSDRWVPQVETFLFVLQSLPLLEQMLLLHFTRLDNRIQLPAKIMNSCTCLFGLYLSAVAFQLWTDNSNRVLHCFKQSAHILTAVQLIRGQNGISRREKFLCEWQK